MKIKNIALIGITILLTLSYFCFFNKQEMINNNSDNQETLTVGIAAGYAPWISINQQGDYEGFDIDIIKQVATNMNKKLVFKDLGSMTSLLMALEQGSIDLIIWGMSITPERLQKYAMVHYQGTNLTTYPLLFWEQIPTGINNFNDMTNMIVCVEPSSAQSNVIAKYPNITILPTDSVDLGLLNIQYKKAVAVFVEPAIAKKFKAKFPEIKTLDILLDKQDQVQGVGMVFKKENFDLIQQVEAAVNELKKNGAIEAAEIAWGL